MIGAMSSATYNPETGQVQVTLSSSTINAYQNVVSQFGTYGVMSVPLNNQLINLDAQVPTQVMVNGYKNTINDENFTINPGEVALYSGNWYNFAGNSGIYMQPVGESNKENAMMGQSTNAVLTDILDLLVSIIDYLGTHTHSAVQSGTDVSGVPVEPVPDDSDVVSDQTYIGDNKNLAITGTYTPHD